MYDDKFITSMVHDRALTLGASADRAKEYADIALEAYKKNDFKKASKMIKKCVNDAVKATKKDGRKSKARSTK